MKFRYKEILELKLSGKDAVLFKSIIEKIQQEQKRAGFKESLNLNKEEIELLNLLEDSLKSEQ
jgi:hypothetical protein